MKYNKNLQNKVFQEKIFKNLERNDYIKRVKLKQLELLGLNNFQFYYFILFAEFPFAL